MTIEDREFEALLRSMPLARPSIAMDARVMAAKPRRSVLPLTILSGSALAAAAALVLAVTLGWFGGPTTTTPADPARGNNTMAADDSLAPMKIESENTVIDNKVTPGDTTNPNPVRQIRVESTDKVIWVGRDDSVHIEHKLKPHQEEIHLPEAPLD